MTSEDLPAVVEVEARAAPNPRPARFLQHDFELNRFSWYCVARVPAPADQTGRSVVGYASMWALPDAAHVIMVAVLPEWRCQGIGRRLMLGLIQHARELDTPAVTLEVRVSNTAARRLYQDLGFRMVGRRVAYYSDTGEDAVLMTLQL
jgi:ribosomal-protein-alanine N-acetyltransferase